MTFLRPLCVLFFFLLPVASFSQDTVTLQLKWWHQFQFAGFYAAQTQGYYAAEGIQVNIKTGKAGISAVKEVTEGRADFGVCGSHLLLDSQHGEPVVALGVIFQHSPYVIISASDKNINRPSDLVGKRVMASERQGLMEIKAMLIKEGISPDSVIFIQHSWNNQDILNGHADAMTGYSSVEPFQLLRDSVSLNILLPGNYGIDFYGDLLFTSKQMTEDNPELTEKFMHASFKGWTYAMEHPEEMVDYIMTLPGVKERGMTRELLLSEFKSMQNLISGNIVEPGHMNAGRWEHILDTYKEQKLLPEKASLNGFLYTKKKPFTEKHSNVFLIVGIVLLGLILLLSVNYFTLGKLVKYKARLLEKEMGEKLLARQELQHSRDMLALAAEASNIAIWEWNLVLDKVFLNDRWYSMLGYSEEELPKDSRLFIQLLHPDDREVVRAEMEDLLQNKKEKFTVIFRHKTKVGAWKWLLGSCKAVEKNEEGKPVRFIGIHIDIDLIKTKEKELYAISRELTHSNKELQQFAYITSHNLRSPVANIISLVRIFQKEKLSPEQNDLLGKIEFSAGRLSETLDDLNMILTDGFNRHRDEIHEVVFEERLNAICKSISEFIRVNEAEINADFSKCERINYHEKTLDSILLNLLTNAIKYKSHDRKPVIHITTREESEYAVLEFADNGSGIDLKKHGHKIFRLYQRFHEQAEGKGIGLYLLKNQIESLEGMIEVKSEPGKGTVFTVYFKKKINDRE